MGVPAWWAGLTHDGKVATVVAVAVGSLTLLVGIGLADFSEGEGETIAGTETQPAFEPSDPPSTGGTASTGAAPSPMTPPPPENTPRAARNQLVSPTQTECSRSGYAWELSGSPVAGVDLGSAYECDFEEYDTYVQNVTGQRAYSSVEYVVPNGAKRMSLASGISDVSPSAELELAASLVEAGGANVLWPEQRVTYGQIVTAELDVADVRRVALQMRIAATSEGGTRVVTAVVGQATFSP